MQTRLTGLMLGTLVLSMGAGTARADVVQDWNLQALRVTFAVGPPQARALAIVHVAMHDAINSVTGEFDTYTARISGAGGASPIAAGATAAHDVLVSLFPTMATSYDDALTASLAGIPEPQKSEGVIVGQQAALQSLLLRMNDGFSLPAPYTPGSGPGVWIPTPPAFAPALLPGFGRVLPFALDTPNQFRPDGPPKLTSKRWAADFNEVRTVGSVDAEARGLRTASQSATARFWLGNMIPIMQGIARQVATARPLSLSESARFFALLNIAGVDSYIAAWDAKFTYNFWRPVTAIVNATSDGNPDTAADPTWLPLGTTPPFPDYVSGHTAYTRACVGILEDTFGHGSIEFTATNPNVPAAEQVRVYSGFRSLSREMIEARILAGIHFRSADVDGNRLGRRVAQFAIRHVLRRSHGHG